jgi:hypothetical protein
MHPHATAGQTFMIAPGGMFLIGKNFTRVGDRYAGLGQNIVLLHILGELFWQFFPQKRLDLNIYTAGAMVLYFGQQLHALLQHFLARAYL